jgi:polyisoprenoid-binding protein YceI
MLQIITGILLYLTVSPHGVVNQQDRDINGKWRIVQDKSGFEFKITAMFIFPVKGKFSGVNGTIEIKNDLYEIDVDLTVDPSTIDTGNEKRDDHLRSEDFFNVDTYPTISFSSSRISAQATGNQYLVEGELTIKDITQTIQVPITFEGLNDQGEVVFSGSKNINRREFNIDYSGKGVGDVAEMDYRIVARKE